MHLWFIRLANWLGKLLCRHPFTYPTPQRDYLFDCGRNKMVHYRCCGCGKEIIKTAW